MNQQKLNLMIQLSDFALGNRLYPRNITDKPPIKLIFLIKSEEGFIL